MLKKIIAGLAIAGLFTALPCHALETAGNIRVTISAEDASVYRVRRDDGYKWDATYSGLMLEEARDVCDMVEHAKSAGDEKNIRLEIALEKKRLETDRNAWDYLTHISHDVFSLMLYERPDLYAIQPETFTWFIPDNSGNDRVKAVLNISLRKTEENKEGDTGKYGKYLETAVSDILANSDYNIDGKTDSAELARGVYEATRKLLSPNGRTADSPGYNAESASAEDGSPASDLVYGLFVKALCDRVGIDCMTVCTVSEGVVEYANTVRIGGETYLMDAYTDDLEEKNTIPTGFLSGADPFDEVPEDMFSDYSGGQEVRDVSIYPAGFPDTEIKLSENPFSYDYTDHHAYSEMYIEPTCTSDGYIEGTCICGDKMRYGIVKSGGHSFTVKEEKKATCTEKGYTKSRCEACGEEQVEIVPPLGHDEAKTVKDATCTQAGSITVTCKRCGTVLSEDEIPPLGHDFSKNEVEKSPTCLSPGYIERKCSRCGETEREETSGRAEHEFRVEETVAPTCTEDGFTFYRCYRCGKIEKGDPVPATGHNYTVETVEASCTQDGYTRHRCENCGDIYDTDPIQAYGHDWQTVETVDSTETDEGYILRVCQRCGEEKTTIIHVKEPETAS